MRIPLRVSVTSGVRTDQLLAGVLERLLDRLLDALHFEAADDKWGSDAG